ncbi:hypothetical protein H2509_16115 [Stappia sp. F7233]|uniref:Uncharacterized protein n=1 Tax=Stappia albiluteola TaxID=2758565 RepID=A0A839AHV2_9HYPH|nr:hypothetical protein [Stappia albiluteola]MBA5778656.1 hypothetical protein [Stappia albiluteola]
MRIEAIRSTNTEQVVRRDRVQADQQSSARHSSANKQAVQQKLPAIRDDAEEKREQTPFQERPQTFTRYRYNTVFLAHLIAARDNAQHLRARRRREPGHAVEAYARAEASHRLPRPGRVLAVSL